MTDAKKKGLFSKIETRDDALKAVKDTSMGFFVVAALQAALSFLVGFSVLVDAALYVIGGFFVRRFHSRVAAVALLLLALVAAGVTVANKLGENLGGGNNILLAVIVLWAAVRAVEATFKLHGRFSEKAIAVEPPST
jgi:predicted ferric reductase